MMNFYQELWTSTINEISVAFAEGTAEGIACMIFYGGFSIILSIPLILISLFIIMIIGFILGEVCELIKLSGMSKEERIAYKANKVGSNLPPRMPGESFEDYRQRVLRDVNLGHYKCPCCGYADPSNEYDNIYGEASGKFKCGNCGHHWGR